ncbi:MAG: undecaprenyldiphospho-muramoylpentapeptide beta-N-acetylglucosaminyltransferase [Bacteroidales bacterium]|jgi:UDP-N-acetylglucosamine--N-acetylmuramyl-(pentapeptide) pyrophosphoryl-undecaprenol N-acetylglucosamine transferase|nr:undecaprenyldiphospho-muramoylpentapeptide beta-N-acetylglucosaminyltransferase [Bacteroidales bacterium]
MKVNQTKRKNIIISGGGTGGHVFPAISIANAIKQIEPESRILFVGALGKIEMEKVPAAGYQIVGLPVTGLQRRITTKNIAFLFKLIRSLGISRKIIRDFNPDVVVGVGGYASGPVLYIANRRRIPTLIQEQNSYAGITNKLLAKKAAKICVAYEGMEKYFPPEKILLTGNPVRQDLLEQMGSKTEAARHFNLDMNKKTLLVIGGSLGARTINQSILTHMDPIGQSDIQLLWQTGKYYYDDAKEVVEKSGYENIKVLDFIVRMDYAYSLADVIISRAGAGTISELCLVGKPVVLVPSPNVAEDHQTKNAMALVNRKAALRVEDQKAPGQLVDLVLDLIHDEEKMNTLSEHIKEMALRDSAQKIAEEVLKLGVC